MEVRIDIYDAAGRWVATPEAGLRPAGEHEVRWEGRGAEGRRVQPGLYFVRLSAGGEDRNRRMVMLQK
jgi:flagellar hook assembly protein FlgD